MTPVLPNIPNQFETFDSINAYRGFCQRNGMEIPMDQIRVLNRNAHDGQLELLYHHSDQGKYCAAHLSLQNMEMSTRAGTHRPWSVSAEGMKVMTDGCSLFTQWTGSDHPEDQVCRDGLVSPRLASPEAKKFSSVEKFANYCQSHLQARAMKRYGDGPVLPFSLNRAQIINTDPYDPFYQLKYQSMGQDFFCEAVIDPVSHTMSLKHGGYWDQETSDTGSLEEMTDVCSLTEYLLGQEKYLGNCTDRTAGERQGEYWTHMGFSLLVNGIALFTGYKMAKAFSTQAWRAATPYVAPLLKQAFQRTFPLWNAIFSLESSALAYLARPLSQVGWASRAGLVGLSFYGGWKVGRGIDQIPRIFGGKQVSDYLADGLYEVAGPAPDWMVDAYDFVGNIF